MSHVIECLECGAALNLATNVMLGEIVSCPDCAVELEIVNLAPVQVDLAPMEVEDWGE